MKQPITFINPKLKERLLNGRSGAQPESLVPCVSKTFNNWH